MAEFTRTTTTITVNGQTYRSVDEMPPEVRRQYEQAMSRLRADANQNGIPDIFESKPADGTSVAEVTTSVHEFVDDLPRSAGLTPVSQELRKRAIARATGAFHDPHGGGSGGIYLNWPTLLAMIATAAVVGAAVTWYLK